LTDWENALREAAGESQRGDTFIGRFLNDVMFFDVAEWILTACYIGFAVLVAGTFWLAPPHRRQRPSRAISRQPSRQGHALITRCLSD
jgi:hypothetical protein